MGSDSGATVVQCAELRNRLEKSSGRQEASYALRSFFSNIRAITGQQSENTAGTDSGISVDGDDTGDNGDSTANVVEVQGEG